MSVELERLMRGRKSRSGGKGCERVGFSDLTDEVNDGGPGDGLDVLLWEDASRGKEGNEISACVSSLLDRGTKWDESGKGFTYIRDSKKMSVETVHG